MQISTYSRTFSLLALIALLSGCASQEYHALQGGYGRYVSYSALPDGASHCRLLYSASTNGHRPGASLTVWPTLLSGYYGNAIVQDDLIVFGARWPSSEQPAGIPAFFAAKQGPPAVDITKVVLRAAFGTSDHSPVDLQYPWLERSNSGVRIWFQRSILGHEDAKRPEMILSWREIDELVTRIRATGMPHHFKSVKYYAED